MKTTITITVKTADPVLGISRRLVKLPTQIRITQDSNDNIVRCLSPHRNTAPLHYTIRQVMMLPSRINK